MDVIFLLLTFFIYAMVLMVRADLLPVRMQQFASGAPATPSPVAAVTIDQAGALFLNREPIALEEIVPRLQEIVRAEPATVIYLAADERGETDRLPRFLELYDRLAFAGLEVRLVGRPGEREGRGANPGASRGDAAPRE